MALLITHVRKDSDGDITHLSGGSWSDTIAGVISDIELGKYSYAVKVNGANADVLVVPATYSRKKHLRTTADTALRNNLDFLPTF